MSNHFKIYSDGVVINSGDLEYSIAYVNVFGGIVKNSNGKILYQKILT